MDQPESENGVVDVADRSRFELVVDGHTVFADYQRREGILVILHVEAPPVLRGSGAAGRLMRGVLDVARAEGRKVVPVCGYAAAFIRRSAEYRDLLA